MGDQFDVEIDWKPIALGAIFQQRGHAPDGPKTPKGAYIRHDVERSAQEWSLPYQWPSPFPFNSINAARIYYFLATADAKEAVRWAQAVFEASYKDGLDCSNLTVLCELAERLGHEGDRAIAATADPQIKKTLIDATNEAAERGVFGAPSLFVNHEHYWGADRIDQILRQLSR